MTDELKPVKCGCGGEAKVIHYRNGTRIAVSCTECDIETISYMTEAEAIEAWNRAMAERTAKVEDLEKRSETSLSWEGICKNCGSYTMHEMNYCFECGARLEWE